MKLPGLFKKKKDSVPHCSAVIVAAGSSQRMGMDKLLAELNGIPVLARTIQAFESSPLVDEIVVVTRMDHLETVADLCHQNGFGKVSRVVCGGATRTLSALAGVSEVKKSARLIAIHDGARPLVTTDVILRTVYAAAEYMAAAPVVPSADTLKQVDDKGAVVATLDREHTVRVQTPQVFRADLIKGALTKAAERGMVFTDDCAAAEMMGLQTHTVLGDEDNIKLTTPRDMVFASEILRLREEKS